VLAFGLLPALEATRSDPLVLLRGAGAQGKRTRDRTGILIVGQVAISLLLLANATVFLRLFERQRNADPGYDVQHLATVSVMQRAEHSTSGDWRAAYDDVMGRITAIPSVRAAAASQGVPLSGNRWFDEIGVPGYAAAAGENRRVALQAIGP